MLASREVFDLQDEDGAKKLMSDAKEIKDLCDEKMSQIVSQDKTRDLSASYALAYRYFKRVASHSFNILTSIVQPLDKLDFAEEVVETGPEE